MEYEEKSIVEMLLDEENDEPITLYDETGEPVRFEQVAIIPYYGDIYAILKPIDFVEDIAEDEALIFKIVEDEDGAACVEMETDADVEEAVFEQYYKLLEEAEEK
ncbi:MAG: DUF1292 domain-containing protein [Christensenellales bacterium]